MDLDPITEICNRLYPNQENVLQATSDIPYWQNGPDCLDYVNIYVNDDCINFENEKCILSHYHFVSLGLSDLYGDERVHK